MSLLCNKFDIVDGLRTGKAKATDSIYFGIVSSSIKFCISSGYFLAVFVVSGLDELCFDCFRPLGR